MAANNINYKIKTAGEKAIMDHLTECADSFIPPLTQKMEIAPYSKKLADKSVTFEAWSNESLVGLIATYINDLENSAFITNVSVNNRFKGAGIGSTLLVNCINYAKDKNINTIRLEVNRENSPALKLYKKFGFTEENSKDDSVFLRRHINLNGN